MRQAAPIPAVVISRGVSLFFGDRSLPAFPSGEHASLWELLEKRLFSQAVVLADSMFPGASVHVQLEILTAKLYALLSLRQVAQAVHVISNFFGVADLSEQYHFRSAARIPTTLQVLSCIVHHLNGDTLRSVSALYLVLDKVDDKALPLFVLARLQGFLGDLEEMERLLDLLVSADAGDEVANLGQELRLTYGLTASTGSTTSGIAAMSQGEYSDALRIFEHNGRMNEAAVASLYASEHNKAVVWLENSVRKHACEFSAASLSNLNLLYGFYKEDVVERKKNVVAEILRLYLPECPLVLGKYRCCVSYKDETHLWTRSCWA